MKVLGQKSLVQIIMTDGGIMSATTFDEEKFNMEVRKFLKKVGVTSQRELERAVRDGLEKGRISGKESLKARMTLEIAELGLNFNIEGDIALS
jgi:hypothetical protein